MIVTELAIFLIFIPLTDLSDVEKKHSVKTNLRINFKAKGIVKAFSTPILHS